MPIFFLNFNIYQAKLMLCYQSFKNSSKIIIKKDRIMNRDEMSNLQRGHSKDAPQHVSIHLAKRFQRRRIFRNQPIRNKNGLWRPCLSTHRDEMSNLYRGSAIDASYQVSVHLAKRCQRRFLKIGQSETRIAYGGHVC